MAITVITGAVAVLIVSMFVIAYCIYVIKQLKNEVDRVSCQLASLEEACRFFYENDFRHLFRKVEENIFRKP